jgi:hypothetical protein
VKQEGSVPLSSPTSFPPIATVASLGKFQYKDMHTSFNLIVLSSRHKRNGKVKAKVALIHAMKARR